MNSKLACLGLLVLLLIFGLGRLIGCHSKTDAITERPISNVHGPHGGHTLTMSRDVDYAMEFTLDEGRRKIIIYVFETSTDLPFAIPCSHLT